MVDLSALARWPNVPACYGWLSLDRRGQWRLQGERVTHRGMIDFVNRQYGVDGTGCGFVQNGPQKVFVDLDATPWIYHHEGNGLVAHTGQPAGEVSRVLLDEAGCCYLLAGGNIGLLDDRDLPWWIGQLAPPAALEAFLAGEGTLDWQGLTVDRVSAVDLKNRFKFTPRPRPDGMPLPAPLPAPPTANAG